MRTVMNIWISQQDIDEAKAARILGKIVARNCPIAIALKKMFKDVSVGLSEAYIDGKYWTLSNNTKVFIYNFDKLTYANPQFVEISFSPLINRYRGIS